MGKIGEMIISLGADNTNLKKNMKQSEGIIQGTMNVISSMKSELATFGALAGPLIAIKSWAAAVNDLEDKTNMAGEAASGLLAIGQYVGLSTEDMAGSLTKMSKSAMTAALAMQTASDSGTASTDVYTRFGIQILDSNNKLLSSEQIYDNVVAKHRSMANGLEKTSMEMEIFGKSGAKLNDMLNLSTAQMDKVKNVAQKAGLVLSHDVTQGFEDAEFQANLAQLSMKGVVASIGTQMLPEYKKLTDTLQELSEYYADLDDATKRDIAVVLEAAGAVATLSVGWRGLVFLAGPVISGINGISAAYDTLAASAWAAKLAVGGVLLALVALVASKAWSDYQHYQAGGKFEYNDLGQVTQVEGSADPMPNGSSGNSDDYDTLSAGFNMYDDNLGKKDTTGGNVSFAPTKSGGSSSGGSSSGGADKTDVTVKETKNIQDSIDDITDAWKEMNKSMSESTLTGNAAEVANLSQTAITAIEGVGDKWNKLSLDYSKLSEDDKATFLKSLDDKKIAYQVDGNDQLTFTKNILAEQKAISDKYYQDLENRHKACKDIQANIDAAYAANSMAQLQAALTGENAERMNNYTAQQSMMQTWQQAFLQAHATTAQLMADLYKGALDGFGTAFSDILTGAKSIQEAFKSLGQTMIKVVADYAAKWLASRIMMGVFGKTMLATETALSIAAGAATAAAWAPAAAAVSLASFGANSAPAMAGITATNALSLKFAGAGLKDGGMVSGSGTGTSDSILTRLSNGEFVMKASAVRNIGVSNLNALNNGGMVSSAVIGGGGTAVLNNYGDINNGSDLNDLYSGFTSLVASAIRGA